MRGDWSRTYVTQFDGAHLTIRRHDGAAVRCGWDVLQRIKDDVVGLGVTCVEVFPAREDLVDEMNIRHLWVVAHEDLRFGWVRGSQGFIQVRP